jgi:hypothetical protein
MKEKLQPGIKPYSSTLQPVTLQFIHFSEFPNFLSIFPEKCLKVLLKMTSTNCLL